MKFRRYLRLVRKYARNKKKFGPKVSEGGKAKIKEKMIKSVGFLSKEK